MLSATMHIQNTLEDVVGTGLTDLRGAMTRGMSRLMPKRSPFKDPRKPTVEELRLVGTARLRRTVRYTMPLAQNGDGKRDGVDFIYAGINRATVRRLARETRTIRDFRGIAPRKRRAFAKLGAMAAAREMARDAVQDGGAE